MGQMITCTRASTYPSALTRGKAYELLAEDADKGKVRIRGDNGRTRWYPASYFDLEGRPVPMLTGWKFDDPIDDDDEATSWVEVSFNLSDGTRRWSMLFTPDRLKRGLEQPNIDPPGFHAPHLIVVRSLDPADVDRTLRYLDEQHELLEASLPIGPSENPTDATEDDEPD